MIEWDQPTRLNTPIGDLLFNQAIADVGYFMIDVSDSHVARGLRVTSDDVPQGDGWIHHRRFTEGVELSVSVELWKTIGDEGEPACGRDLRLMLEHLARYLTSVLNGRGRWFWSPSADDDLGDYIDGRMLDECRWLTDVSRTLEGKTTTVTFGLDSPFPYFIDATELTEHIDSGSGVSVVTNRGNHYMRPVIKAYGPALSFEIRNESVLDADGEPLAIVYEPGRPGAAAVGAAHYIEFDTFRETAYLDGDQANRKAGVDPETTDYFYLQPGDNQIVADGADIDILYNGAWVPV